MHHRIIRCWRPRGQNLSGSFHATVGWTAAHPSVHPVLKDSSWRVSVLFKCVHRIDWRLPPMDCRFIRRCCPSRLLSAIRLTLLKTGPSVHPTVPWLSPSVPTRLTIAPMLVIEVSLVHLIVSFLFLSFLIFDPWKIDYLLNLACDIFASLGPRIVYKDMLNNMISPIDHVVMNHQNHTRTNGIWGHVRYTNNPWETHFHTQTHGYANFLWGVEDTTSRSEDSA
jgi:hypothetical protein